MKNKMIKKYQFVFFSYNRDELDKTTSNNNLHNRLAATLKMAPNINGKFYIDVLNPAKTNPTIFKNIKCSLNKQNAVLLLISDSNSFYGWTEKEILYAISINVDIYLISTKKIEKFIDNICRSKTSKTNNYMIDFSYLLKMAKHINYKN